jgi:hypothetical protein
MMNDLLTFLPQMLAGGAVLVLIVLTIRLADQWARDTAGSWSVSDGRAT